MTRIPAAKTPFFAFFLLACLPELGEPGPTGALQSGAWTFTLTDVLEDECDYGLTPGDTVDAELNADGAALTLRLGEHPARTLVRDGHSISGQRVEEEQLLASCLYTVSGQDVGEVFATDHLGLTVSASESLSGDCSALNPIGFPCAWAVVYDAWADTTEP
jgi:hypothetical protein